jgi:hypothetical protein
VRFTFEVVENSAINRQDIQANNVKQDVRGHDIGRQPARQGK